MVDQLMNPEEAIYSWWQHNTNTGQLNLPYRARSDVCGGVTVNWQDKIYFQRLVSTGMTPALIGVDSATGFGYWHIAPFTAQYVEIVKSLFCFTCVQIIGPFPPTYNSSIYEDHEDGHDIIISDLHSSTRPLDGAEVVPHSGYPACVAVQLSPGKWLSFLAGDIAGLTLADAQALVAGTGWVDSGIGGALESLALRFHWL